jgi:hypothetical protein
VAPPDQQDNRRRAAPDWLNTHAGGALMSGLAHALLPLGDRLTILCRRAYVCLGWVVLFAWVPTPEQERPARVDCRGASDRFRYPVVALRMGAVSSRPSCLCPDLQSQRAVVCGGGASLRDTNRSNRDNRWGGQKCVQDRGLIFFLMCDFIGLGAVWPGSDIFSDRVDVCPGACIRSAIALLCAARACW